MNENTTGNFTVLRHEPYGERHPYTPLPYERIPRDPTSGDKVIIHVETGHDPDAEYVWCEWSEDGKNVVNQVEGLLLDKGEDVDHWQVNLPAFLGGERIRYKLFARNNKTIVQSEEFDFYVSTWIETRSVLFINETNSSLDAVIATDRDNLCVNLTLDFNNQNHVNMRISANKGADHFSPISAATVDKTWGNIKIVFQTDPFSVELVRLSDGLSIKNSKSMKVLVDEDGCVLKYELGFESPSDEAFFGFGERFNALDQRGNHLDNYVFHQYTNQGKKAYIPIPFFVSSRGYGVWLQTDRQAEFDLASLNPNKWSMVGHAEQDSSLRMIWFFESKPFEITQAFTDLTGKPKLPPNWVFGLWMSSNDWNSQSEVIRQLHETQNLQIPASVLVIEAWSDEINFYIWNDAKYKIKPSAQSYSLSDFKFPPEGRWPDPKSMIAELHQSGVRLILWQNPVIKFGNPHENLDETLNRSDQEYAIEKGYVVKKDDGTPHRVEAHGPWFCNSLVLDFSNPEAVDWWFRKREYLVTELGVDGFKTDGGEHIWDINTCFSNGISGHRGINLYPLYYEAAYDRCMEERRGKDFVLFSRAGYTGAQKYPCHWAGDEKSTWDAYRATVRALLNAGICGLPFVGWDIAGFSGPIPSSELYLRSSAFSVFCPIMQYHSDVNHQRIPSRDRTPWNIQLQTGDQSVVPFFRNFANLRMNLLPYILDQARKSSETGLPLMRTISLVYPLDTKCRKYPYEYLFGDAILVAPIVEEGVENWPVYLPHGKWMDLFTGKVIQGPLEVNVEVPLDRIPAFQKSGSILPLNLNEDLEICSPVGNSSEEYQKLAIQIFPEGCFESNIKFSPEGETSPILVEMDDGKEKCVITFPPHEKSVFLFIHFKEPKTVMLDSIRLEKREKYQITEAPSTWQWLAQKYQVMIHLPKNQIASKIVLE